MPNPVDLVFYYLGPDVPDYAETFSCAVKEAMPHARIHQLTDFDTPAFPGIDQVHRSDPFFPITRDTLNLIGYHYLSTADLGPSIFVDPDMLVLKDLSDLMEGDFDVAAALRPTGDPVTIEWAMRYPYCSLMAVKNPKFWRDVYKRMFHYPVDWYTNMEAVKDVIDSGKYKIRLLDGDIYNAVPTVLEDRVKVYHYKGYFKDVMRDLYQLTGGAKCQES